MLVMSRKEGETIFVGDDIKVVIVRAGSDKVRIGIDAPKEVPVDRQEIRERPDYRRQKPDGGWSHVVPKTTMSKSVPTVEEIAKAIFGHQYGDSSIRWVHASDSARNPCIFLAEDLLKKFHFEYRLLAEEGDSK